MPIDAPDARAADHNWRWFVWFRVLFAARFYYPVMAVLFLDLGLSASEYTVLNHYRLKPVGCGGTKSPWGGSKPLESPSPPAATCL